MLELVKAIEEENSLEEIVKDFNFEVLFDYFEQIQSRGRLYCGCGIFHI